MLGKAWSRWQLVILGCTLLYAAVFIVVLLFHPGGPLFDALYFHHHPLTKVETDGKFYGYAGKVYKDFQDIYQILPPFFAAICGLLYAWRGLHHNKTRRWGWLLVALGALAFGIGQIIWTYYEAYKGDVPSPYSWADAGYLGAYPFMVGGVILLFGSMRLTGRARLVLDSALAASSIGVVSWYFLVQGLWAQTAIDLYGKLVSVAYPLSDIVVLFCSLSLVSGRSNNKQLRRSFIILALGLSLVSFADSLYSYLNFTNSYQTGSWFDWGWSFGWLLVGYAFLIPLWWPQASAEIAPLEVMSEFATAPAPAAGSVPLLLSLTTLARLVFPYVAAATAFSYIASSDYTAKKVGGHYLGNTVVLLGGWLIFLVILRQVLTLLENQVLTVRLRLFNEQLEQIVKRRTEQLTKLHMLTKAVNTTLVEDEVIAAAIEHTQQALQADAVVVRLVTTTATDTEQLEAPIYKSVGLEDQAPLAAFISALPLKMIVETLALPTEVLSGHPKASYLRAPLIFQQKQIGMIGALHWDTDFGPTEPAMLESIGLEVGTAYENARRYRLALEAADRDAVTGLYNHRAIHQRLDAEFQRATRKKSPLSLMMMDLNNFKLFNDTYGHPVGDQVLKTVARVLEDECRAFDIIGRYGGDEFLVILPDTEEPMALGVAQRLRDRMSREGFKHAQNENTIPVTLSCGIATYPHASDNRHELLTIADANLYTAKISSEGIVGTTETQRAHRELRTEESFGVLESMITAVDNKDRYTRRHSEDVTEYALWIGEELGLSEETMRIIRVGGLLHDVGKIGVPDEILRKPGKLTDEEYEILKRHPQLGALIVSGVPGMEAIVDAVRSHHERWDGRGYPDALAGEAIPFLGRLMGVPDAFSAMTTSRPYRKGLEWESAIAEIRRHTGTQFDPEMARAFLAAAEKRRAKAQVTLPTENDAEPTAHPDEAPHATQ